MIMGSLTKFKFYGTAGIAFIIFNYFSSFSLTSFSRRAQLIQVSPLDFNKHCSRDNQAVAHHCKQEHVTCMDHNHVDDKILHDTNDPLDQGCKTLWFTGIHESEEMCDISDTDEPKYNLDYAVGLKSALENAKDSLQPVLLLGRFGTEYENSTRHKHFGTWAEKRGVKVIYSPRLSFQQDVIDGLPAYFQEKLFSRLQGPFLSLDIPKLIKDHDLFNMPNICKSHVLYTDADIIFANKMTKNEISSLVRSMGDASVSYGQEHMKLPTISNTGVMFINVERFEQDIPKVLEQARNENKYPINDHHMLKSYQKSQVNPDQMFKVLPYYYDWKAHWDLTIPFNKVKILHLHGTKAVIDLETIAKCDVADASKVVGPYRSHLYQGICCDGGRTARWAVGAIKRLSTPIYELCDLGVDGYREMIFFNPEKKVEVKTLPFNRNTDNFMDVVEKFLLQ